MSRAKGAPRAAARGAGTPARDVLDVEVVEDRTAGSKADEGFLRVRRLVLRNVYADGTRSKPYDCDVVSRTRTDAVAVVLYEVGPGRKKGPRSVRVALKTGLRAPVFLRRRARLVQPDARPYGVIAEIVAGMLEPEDAGEGGVERRAAREAHEEARVRVRPSEVEPLGAEAFPSPGITDEKVHFRAVRAGLSALEPPGGDGSVMEEGGGVWVLPLEEAIEACRTGAIPDMKTEIALLRLADHLAYVPSLGRFVDELPDELRAAWSPLGTERARP